MEQQEQPLQCVQIDKNSKHKETLFINCLAQDPTSVRAHVSASNGKNYRLEVVMCSFKFGNKHPAITLTVCFGVTVET